ncbi:MAG: hypothetical protein P8Y10_16170, partial [Gemmatimonadales bacterium]
VFNRSYMSELLSEHVEGRIDHNYRLWLLLNLEVWYRLHIDGSETDEVLSWLVAGKDDSTNLTKAAIG